MRVDVLTHAIFNAARDPEVGGLFVRMILGELTFDDVVFANELGFEGPTWVSVIAGGNPEMLGEVAEISLEFFLYDLMIEAKELEEALVHETMLVYKDRDLFPTNN